MALRNRTNEFKKIRENYHNENSSLGVENLLKNKIETNIKYENKDDKINNYDKQIKTIKLNIESQIIQLKKLHNERLMINFILDEESQEIEIENQLNKIKSNIKMIQNIITKISIDDKIDNIFKKHYINNQTMSLQNIINNLRKCQKYYLEKISEQKNIGSDEYFWKRLNNNNKIVNNKSNKNTVVKNNIVNDYNYINKNEENEQPEQQESCLKIINSNNELEKDLNIIESTIDLRDKEITQIVKSIEELNELFKEVSMLVHIQGTILDNIEHNLDVAVENVKSGKTHIEKADKHDKSATSISQKVILGLITLIGVTTSIFAIKKSNGF